MQKGDKKSLRKSRRKFLKQMLVTQGAIAMSLSILHPVATSAKELTPLQLPAGFQYPNGIARASNGTLYVGSITSGQILQIDPNGKIKTLFPGNNEIFAATSLRLDEPRGILWGTSPDFLGTQPNSQTTPRPHRLFALDIRSGKVMIIGL